MGRREVRWGGRKRSERGESKKGYIITVTRSLNSDLHTRIS